MLTIADTFERNRQAAIQRGEPSPAMAAAEQTIRDRMHRCNEGTAEANARDAIALGFGSDAFRIRYRHRFLSFDGLSLASAEALVGRWVADEMEANRVNVRIWGFLQRQQMSLRTIREVEAILRIIRADGLAVRFPAIVDAVTGFATGFLREAAE